MMPASFLARHRTICGVLEEIKLCHDDDEFTKLLCDEAIGYAQSMSKKLTEYKEKERGYTNSLATRKRSIDPE